MGRDLDEKYLIINIKLEEQQNIIINEIKECIVVFIITLPFNKFVF